MKLLLLGDDARAHTLVARLIESARAPEVVCAPGNGGTAPLAATLALDVTDPVLIARVCFEEFFDLVIPADSRPLRHGLADEALGLQVGVCGAAQRTTTIEYSRCALRAFVERHEIAAPAGRAFADLDTAERYLAGQRLPVVIKPDSPDSGEERFDDRYSAIEALRNIFAAQKLDGGAGVVIEEPIDGPVVALTAFADGIITVPMLATRRYDRVADGDTGAYAVGVGAHTGSSALARELTRYLHTQFIQPIAAALAADDLPCWGMLGVDCVITATGPRLTAIRFSLSPAEAETVLIRLEDDLLLWLEATHSRRLSLLPPPRWSETPSVTIGLMARGYPGFFPYGGPVSGLTELDEGVRVTHNATIHPAATFSYTTRAPQGSALAAMIGGLMGMGTGGGANGPLRTTGGLPLRLTVQAGTLAGARGRALLNAERIQFEGRTFRSDIGMKEFG